MYSAGPVFFCSAIHFSGLPSSAIHYSARTHLFCCGCVNSYVAPIVPGVCSATAKYILTIDLRGISPSCSLVGGSCANRTINSVSSAVLFLFDSLACPAGPVPSSFLSSAIYFSGLFLFPPPFNIAYKPPFTIPYNSILLGCCCAC